MGVVIEHHHRNIQGGAARAAVFGVSDGLVSNIALVLGVAGANPAPGVVRLAGLVGLLGGAFSMAAGEYVSMQAQRELLQRELDIERVEIERRPENERRELAQIYKNRGVAADVADRLATEMMADPELALETHAREELGIDPGELGSPVNAAVSSFVAFGVGAIVPLLPWFFAHGTAALVASMALGAVAALVIGVLLARFTERPVLVSATRQIVIAALAAGVPFLIGRAVGVSTGG
ncbi:MAG: vacuolar iron transporter family protein [Actinomycetota bacterium]|jgi:VIT1/CCC1 family predicted Fe2+/Mn2+ transporter|nr:vacuolar iron transporter family protein [Actinomycetota bacterium]